MVLESVMVIGERFPSALLVIGEVLYLHKRRASLAVTSPRAPR
jgi:hypothetical protein